MPLIFKKKRAALCFYGQLRQVKKTYVEYIFPNIIEPNSDYWDMDVFVHTWWDASDLGKSYKVWGKKEVPETAPVPDDVLDTVFKIYNPKKILAERQIDFSYKTNKYHSYHIDIILPVPTQSKSYSLKQVSLLKRKYEEENNFKYDLVANMRFDQGMQNKIDFFSFPPGHYHTSPRAWTPNNPVVDCIVGFMDSKIYDYMADMYDVMDEYWEKEKVEFLEEHLLVHHLEKNNIPIVRHPNLNDYILVR